MTHLLMGPFYAACLLLVFAGAQKAVRPDETARALRIAGLPIPSSLVRGVGSFEGALGVAAIVTGERLLAGAIAASYLMFALFVLWLRQSGSPLRSCGCFGKADTPPTRTHMVINLILSGIAISAVVRPLANIKSILAAQPAAGLPLIALTGVTTFGLILMLGPASEVRNVRHPQVGGSS